MKNLVIFIALTTIVAVQSQQYTTPVPILKQINRHNEDGSYSFGYEAADGSFKIETKHPNGEVFGKYGYVDAGGKLREISYGASKRGFEPEGTDINVPPPTLDNNPEAIRPLGPNEEDDGQYREDPSVYYKEEKYNTPVRSQPATQHGFNYQAGPNQYYNENAAVREQAPVYQQPQHRFNYQQPHYYQPQSHGRYQAHPAATHFDINTGSYTLQYTG
ncbi:cuticle protein 3 [Phlebotomus argentipes]|uniref:cuticle protein 3 n=1 Tax=Phlebotomus argentipes TaxID=94469 RepID=UPI0028931F39|nr:cuticle protein 3 [Phlebotomus argentipes]